MSVPQTGYHVPLEMEGSSNNIRGLQLLLQHKHEQLLLGTEVVNQLTQQTQRQALVIRQLHSRLGDSQCTIDALESSVRDNQHRINHMIEHHDQTTHENVALSDKLSAAKDQISDQRTTIEIMRHTLQQQEMSNRSAMERQLGNSHKEQAELDELRQKHSALMAEKKKMKRNNAKMSRRNTFLESFVAQMTVENLKLNKRVSTMDRKLDGCGGLLERQNQEIEGLRAQNKELLDRVSRIGTVPVDHQQDGHRHDDGIKELMDHRIDQCIQVDVTEHVDTDHVDRDHVDREYLNVRELPFHEMKGEEPRSCGVAEDECFEDSLLTVVQQYEDHQEYLDQELDTEQKDEEEDDERVRMELAVSKEKERADFISNLVREGIEREEEIRKNGTKGSKRGIWEFFTSRIDSAMSWI